MRNRPRHRPRSLTTRRRSPNARRAARSGRPRLIRRNRTASWPDSTSYGSPTTGGPSRSGSFARARVVVDRANDPLTETIQALITGPSGNELDEGLLNLIPNGTQLISAHVQNGTAFLNFNQSFRFNPLGAEGTVAQLLQVIYSSTEFSTVERVQFLVEGAQLDYLGGDGIYVGEPLGRDAFSS